MFKTDKWCGKGGIADGYLYLLFLFLWPNSNYRIFYSWNHFVGQ